MIASSPISCLVLVIVLAAYVKSKPVERHFDNQVNEDVSRFSKANSDTRNPTDHTPRKKFSDIIDALKSLANTRVAKIKHQEEDTDAFNSIIGNVDLNNVKWINMDKNDLNLNLDQEGQKPFQIVYDASRKPIGYIAEAPTTPPPRQSNENYYIDSILNSLNSKNMLRQSEKEQLLTKLKVPTESNTSSKKRIIIRRVPSKPTNPMIDMNQNMLPNTLGTPEVQETIIDPVKRTVTTISKYPPYNENEIMNAQMNLLRQNPLSPFSQYFGQFSQYFPVLIRDPFQSYYNSFTDLIEYGEDADICSKTKENVRQGKETKINYEDHEHDVIDENQEEKVTEAEQKEVPTHRIRKRSTYTFYPTEDYKEEYTESRRMNTKSATKFHKKKPFGHKITSTFNKIKENKESLDSNSVAPEGYGGTNISSLKVRRGGVAIAGPGGIATAGSGGTAILGPGQSAYTTAEGENNRRSGGVAVVGPSHKIISVPNLQESKLLNLPPGAKLLTTGPIVYMNPVDKTDSHDNLITETVSS
ncbi:hypothetical protein WDU94_009575 [Cyamophila willieti]